MQNHNYVTIYQNTKRIKLVMSETGFVNRFDGTIVKTERSKYRKNANSNLHRSTLQTYGIEAGEKTAGIGPVKFLVIRN